MLDISSGIEKQKGQKDLDLIAEFLQKFKKIS